MGYLLSILRTIVVSLGMVCWMMAYGVSMLWRKHSMENALALREHFLRNFAFPIFGLNVQVEGLPIKQPALYVANHRSFTDPIIICRYLKAFVVAKAEVANYPIISQGAVLTGVMWVKRDSKDSRNSIRQTIIDTIINGYNVLIYPEGTVGVEQGTLPFKVGSFAEAVKHNIPIVPIAIEYQSEKDMWTVNSFVRQFMIMYSKWRTNAKLSFGNPIIGSDVETIVNQSQSWIDAKLLEMQSGWSEVFKG